MKYLPSIEVAHLAVSCVFNPVIVSGLSVVICLGNSGRIPHRETMSSQVSTTASQQQPVVVQESHVTK